MIAFKKETGKLKRGYKLFFLSFVLVLSFTSTVAFAGSEKAKNRNLTSRESRMTLGYFFWKVKTYGELKKLYETSKLSKKDKSFILKRFKGVSDDTGLPSVTVFRDSVLFKDSKVKLGFEKFPESAFTLNGKPLKITGFQETIRTIEKSLSDSHRKSASGNGSEFEKIVSNLFFPRVEAIGVETVVAVVVGLLAFLIGYSCVKWSLKCSGGPFGAMVEVAGVVIKKFTFMILGLISDASAREIDIKCPKDNNGKIALAVTDSHSRISTYEWEKGTMSLPKDVEKVIKEMESAGPTFNRGDNSRAGRDLHRGSGEATVSQEDLKRNLADSFKETGNLCEKSPEEMENLVRDMNNFLKESRRTYKEEDDEIFSESAA